MQMRRASKAHDDRPLGKMKKEKIGKGVETLLAETNEELGEEGLKGDSR